MIVPFLSPQTDTTSNIPFSYLTFYYIGYGSLPVLLGLPLIFVIIVLLIHCKQEEYVSLTANQRPLRPCDWDVESGLLVSEEQQLLEKGVTNEQELGESGNTSDASDNVLESEGGSTALGMLHYSQYQKCMQCNSNLEQTVCATLYM